MAKPLPTVLTMAQIQLIDRVDRYMRYEPRHTRVNVVDFYTAWLACRVGALEELSNAGFGSQVTELVYNWCLGLQARGGDPTTTLLSWNTMYGMAVADNTPDRLAHAECMRKVKLERYGALRSLKVMAWENETEQKEEAEDEGEEMEKVFGRLLPPNQISEISS